MKNEPKWSSRVVLPRSGDENEWKRLPQRKLAEMYFAGSTQDEMVKRFGPIARDVFSPDIFRSCESLLCHDSGLGGNLRTILDLPAADAQSRMPKTGRLFENRSANGDKTHADPLLCLAALHNTWQRRESLFMQRDPDTGRTLFQDLVLTRPAEFLLLFHPDEWERFRGDSALLSCSMARKRFEDLIMIFLMDHSQRWRKRETNDIGSSCTGLWRIIRGVASDRRGVPLLRNDNAKWGINQDFLGLIRDLPRLDFAGATAGDLLFTIPGTKRYPHPVRPLDLMVWEIATREIDSGDILSYVIPMYVPLMRSLVECEWADKVFMEPVPLPPKFRALVSRTLVGALVRLVAAVSCEAERSKFALDRKSETGEADMLLTGILRRGGTPAVVEAMLVLKKMAGTIGFRKIFPLSSDLIETVRCAAQADLERWHYEDPGLGETGCLDERGFSAVKNEPELSFSDILHRSGNEGSEFEQLSQQKLGEMYFAGSTREEMVKRFGPIVREIFSPDLFRSHDGFLSHYFGLGEDIRLILDTPATEVSRLDPRPARFFDNAFCNGFRSLASPLLCLAALHNTWQRRESLFLQVDPDTGRTLFQDLVLTRPVKFLLLFRPDEWERYGGDEALLAYETGRKRIEELIGIFAHRCYSSETDDIGPSCAGLWRIIRAAASDRRGISLLRNGDFRWGVDRNLLGLIRNLPRLDFAGATADDLLFSIPGTKQHPYPVRPLDLMVWNMATAEYSPDLYSRLPDYVSLLRSLGECEWANAVILEQAQPLPDRKPIVSRTLIGAFVVLFGVLAANFHDEIKLRNGNIPEGDRLLELALRRGGPAAVTEAISVLKRMPYTRFGDIFPISSRLIKTVECIHADPAGTCHYEDPGREAGGI